jgi:hypothetical protein
MQKVLVSGTNETQTVSRPFSNQQDYTDFSSDLV